MLPDRFPTLPNALARRIRAWVLPVLAGRVWPALAVGSPAPLVLDDGQTRVDLWPALRMLSGPSPTLDVTEVRTKLAQFESAQGPKMNLGVRSDAVWLHVPLSVPPQASGRWLLDTDCASLDRADV